MSVAAIDIGTNSVLLLVASRDGGELRAVREEATITRLGQGVDATGALAVDAMDRTAACLERYAAIVRELGVARLGAVATSAMRDADGGSAFLDRAEAVLGVRPDVISGEREARLTFDGALGGLAIAGRPITGRVAVFDVGGGSTELISGEMQGSADGVVHQAVSLDVGAVRLTERHVTRDPPAKRELEAMLDDVECELAGAPDLRGMPLVGVAGTVTTLAALDRAESPYDGARVHGATLGADTIAALLQRLARLTVAERRALPGIDPRRADVIVAGAAIVSAVLGHAQASALIASDRGVRWGLARSLAREVFS